MLSYRINRSNFDGIQYPLDIETIELVDFTKDLIDSNCVQIYSGGNIDKIMVICTCKDINRLHDGSSVTSVNEFTLSYDNYQSSKTYMITDIFQIYGINQSENTFSFAIDKYYNLDVDRIVCNNYDNSDVKNDVFLYCNKPHYFDGINSADVYFKYYNTSGTSVESVISFNVSDEYTLSISQTNFRKTNSTLYNLIFDSGEETEEDGYETVGNIGNIEIYREQFLFGTNCQYSFSIEKVGANINVPITNSFDTTLLQTELLDEYFVEDEKKKAINNIIDIEKDVYYPSIYTINENGTYIFEDDVYKIKFNLHFREHRGNNWLVDSKSMWNGVNSDKSINDGITKDDTSDLLSFLNFNNEDVHYQKNRLKRSFLRLSFYDSMNSANQNLLGYSTVFFNTGELFAKYVKFMEEDEYTMVGADIDTYGVYNPVKDRVGIKVDRIAKDFDEAKELSTQIVITSKNLSSASSEGFYFYLWRDNESAIPQDIYMKVEFNHAGYGRTIPFMIPFNDKYKHTELNDGSFKSFQQILNDFKNNNETERGEAYDGPYGMKQYIKYSYLHLKYCYDKDNEIHRYFIDPDIYGDQKNDDHEIIINLYEAKIGTGDDENN